MITLYRITWIVLIPVWLLWLLFRVFRGKENWRRLPERFGFSNVTRPKGSVIWIHAASVGESLIAVNLINKLSVLYKNHHFLITTGTIGSTKMIATRMPKRAIHQMIPLDEYFCVKRFFDFWKPELGILVESEIWPNLLDIGSTYCKLALVNAIMSDRSYNKWMGYPKAARHCLSKFSEILCQSARDAKKYTDLCGAKSNTDVINLGNLKFAAPKPLVDENELIKLAKQIDKRHVVLAASTHPGDEEIIIKTHIALKEKYPDLLTIIAPRHAFRSDDIVQLIKAHQLSCSVRSKSEKISNDIDIYLANTIGELGLFFTLAKVTIMGGSFKNGGHNPIEPAFFDTHIILGPDMHNFKDVTKDFLELKAAIQINDLEELESVVSKALQTKTSDNPRKVLALHDGIMGNYLARLAELLQKR